jgi:hypothetical protein
LLGIPCAADNTHGHSPQHHLPGIEWTYEHPYEHAMHPARSLLPSQSPSKSHPVPLLRTRGVACWPWTWSRAPHAEPYRRTASRASAAASWVGRHAAPDAARIRACDRTFRFLPPFSGGTLPLERARVGGGIVFGGVLWRTQSISVTMATTMSLTVARSPHTIRPPHLRPHTAARLAQPTARR